MPTVDSRFWSTMENVEEVNFGLLKERNCREFSYMRNSHRESRRLNERRESSPVIEYVRAQISELSPTRRVSTVSRIFFLAFCFRILPPSYFSLSTSSYAEILITQGFISLSPSQLVTHEIDHPHLCLYYYD